jgi:putative ABC transport system permease protein
MKRRHLIQQFIAEGTAYDLGSALIGAAAGVLTAFVIAIVMGELIGEFFSITPHATFRSLVVAYALGVSVTFVTIIFASVRSSRLNIVAAIRDLPESKTPNPEAATWFGRITPLLKRTSGPAGGGGASCRALRESPALSSGFRWSSFGTSS